MSELAKELCHKVFDLCIYRVNSCLPNNICILVRERTATPCVFQTFAHKTSPPACSVRQSGSWSILGEVGWANVWKMQGGAVRSVTYIYSLMFTLATILIRRTLWMVGGRGATRKQWPPPSRGGQDSRLNQKVTTDLDVLKFKKKFYCNYHSQRIEILQPLNINRKWKFYSSK